MYHRKTEHQMIWQETRQDVALVLRQISGRLQNEILAELDKEFVAALTAGKVISFEFSKGELHRRFAAAAVALNEKSAALKAIGG